MARNDDPNRREDAAHRHPSKSSEDSVGEAGGGEETVDETLDDHHQERFSEGQETTGDTAEKEQTGTFAEGQAVTPDDPEETKEGEFSTGMEQRPVEHDRDVRRDRKA